jgi:hypothetical protein
MVDPVEALCLAEVVVTTKATPVVLQHKVLEDTAEAFRGQVRGLVVAVELVQRETTLEQVEQA